MLNKEKTLFWNASFRELGQWDIEIKNSYSLNADFFKSTLFKSLLLV